MKPRRRAAAPRAVLPLIAGMLILSGSLRVVFGAGVATAEAAAPDPESAAGQTLPDTTPESLIAAFADREARLTAREDAIADRLQALVVIEAEVTEKISALQAAEQSLAALIALAETAAEDDLGQLTLVYENMKPADAAALFETMDAAFAAGFLGRMTPQAAAAIMAGLTPETAYSISAILAGRNAQAPTE